MGWNDSNDWFVGPEYETWKYDVMPEVSPKTIKVISKVRYIFPSAIVFKDTHVYDNRAHTKKLYSVGECSTFSEVDLIMITGDYQTEHHNFRIKGQWAVSIDEAWENAWTRIQETMLKKLEQ
jgi:hypothetical protein